MSMMNTDLSRALMAERQREFLGRAPRPTRLSPKRPEPSVRRTPGLLARLVPWFGAPVRTA